MNNTNIVTAYHTTKRDNVRSIKINGFYPSSPKRNHWLGKGVYFYQDIYFAVQWAFIGVMKNDIKDIKTLVDRCAILSADIDTENYNVLDVNTPNGYAIYLKLLEVIKKHYSEDKYKEILNKGDLYIIKVLENLEQIDNQKNISNFDIICAEYGNNIYNKKLHSRSDFLYCTEKQICVKNIKAIKNINEVQVDESIEENFELVKKNRGECNG